MRRKKLRSGSSSSYDSALVSIPSDNPSDNERPATVPSRPSSALLKGGAPNAINLFDDDNHVINTDRRTKREPGESVNGVIKHTRKVVHHVRKSKREIAHEEEVPIWDSMDVAPQLRKNTAPVPASKRLPAVLPRAGHEIDNTPTPSDEEDEDEESEPEGVTHLVYNKRNKLNLTAQTTEIQDVARLAIGEIEVKIITENAYPEFGKRREVALGCFVTAAVTLGAQYVPILRRLQDDTEKRFRNALAELADARISVIRRDIKVIATNFCVGHYGLTYGQEAHVQDLLKAQRYIFAGDHRPGGQIKWNQPWRADAIIGVMQAAYFTGRRNFVKQHKDIFTDLARGGNEPEVPAPMVALVCTAVHAAIAEWSTGQHVPADFTGSNWSQTYSLHVGMLESARTNKPALYHETMQCLWKACRTSAAHGAGDVHGQPNALSLIDLSAL
ncbi:hypothetical protein OE88DRAFT_1657067 [Heliocybe sulcata]|uniref:DUF6532 domain-containing protein n=1 Tax=Heliocybe sulcata TaxID=5364 RepID=A0A5C3N8L5_9AGAM|nr:hypothetical protein OE88DRAFT_1657067 [Heliocybe sulcata]